jgi:hypothetical protein
MVAVLNASEVDRPPLTPEEYEVRLELLTEQARELTRQCALDTTITCPCGATSPIWRAVRCLFCGVWLCEPCAARHFEANGDKGPVLSVVGQRLKVLGDPLYVVEVQPFPEAAMIAPGC